MNSRPFSLDDVRQVVTAPETAITADGGTVVYDGRRFPRQERS